MIGAAAGIAVLADKVILKRAMKYHRPFLINLPLQTHLKAVLTQPAFSQAEFFPYNFVIKIECFDFGFRLYNYVY